MRPPASGWRAGLGDSLAIAAAFAVPLVLLAPLDDTPFVDDWVYGWSVANLLATGRLRLLEWSSNWNPAQVLWGAAFCVPGGFSFAALRLSTWVLAALGLIGLYRLLRELAVDRAPALLGTAALAVHPLWLLLSFTFMSDVPFCAVSIWALLAGARALRTGSSRALAAAAALSAVACAIRFVGVALPLALAAAIATRDGGVIRARPRDLAVALAPLLVIVAALGLGSRLAVSPVDVSLVPAAPSSRWTLLPWAVPSLPRTLPLGIGFAAAFVGVALFPLDAALVGHVARGRAAGFALATAGLLAGLALAGAAPDVLLFGDATWTLAELGATAPLIAGYGGPPASSWEWAIAVLASASAGTWLAFVARRPAAPAESLLAWLLAGHVGLVVVLWLFYDRYGLVLIAPAIALLLASGARPRPSLAMPILVAYALLGMVGVRDHLALSRALWEGVAWLRARGVAVSEIDGGYVVNGWLQYAHPENAPRDAAGRPFVPDLTVSRGGLRYQLALRELPGWRVVGRLPYDGWLARAGAVLVLERDGA